jgi:putative hydrolase of the HAD superfamily
MGVLSNTDPLHVAYMEATYGFLKLFPVRIYSCRVGASKPDPIIYKKALEACKARAQEAVYVDDIPSYAEAAERLGMRGIVFDTPEQLWDRFRQFGIDVT